MCMRLLGSVFGSFGILLVFAIGVGTARADAPKNVILMIGDGMGPAQVELARRFEPDGILVVDELDSAPGSMTTDNYWGETTDSAEAATAMATGMKTHNGALAMVPDPDDPYDVEKFWPVETVLERAEANGKTTGIVSNVYITDATPGVWAAHVVDRSLSAEIAEQQAFAGVEVLLGACEECYLPDWIYGANIDLIEILTSDDPELGGYDYVDDERGLLKRNTGKGGKLLGLFAGFSMTSTIDRPLKKKMTEPTLAQMTAKAIEILSRNPEGFFLMVEGGELDWMGHRLDPAGSLREMQSFDEAVAVALDFAVRDGNTLLLVTADHECGGLEPPGDDLNMDFLEGIRASTKYIWEEIEDGMSLENALETYAGIGDDWPALTQEEKQAIESCGRSLGIADVLSARAGVVWGFGDCHGGNHTSTPVPIYATGPGADQFDSADLDNTDLGVLLLEAVSGN